MEKILDDFFGRKIPIAGERAKNELTTHGEESLDLVAAQFGKRGFSLQVEMRLADLFGSFGNASLPRLLSVFEKGDWHAMIMASPSFSKLPI